LLTELALRQTGDRGRSAITLIVTLNMTCVNFTSLTELSMRGILFPVMLCQTYK